MDVITNCLWSDRRALEMAEYYVALFPGSAVTRVDRAPADYPAGKAGDVLTVQFRLGGRAFMALNGGAGPAYSEALSLSIDCADQAEVDRYWAALSAHPDKEMCGWCRDRFGIFWQVIPRRLPALLGDADRAKAGRAMQAMMDMRKIDVAALERAAEGVDA